MSLTERYDRYIPIDFTVIGIVPEHQLHVKGVGFDASRDGRGLRM